MFPYKKNRYTPHKVQDQISSSQPSQMVYLKKTAWAKIISPKKGNIRQKSQKMTHIYVEELFCFFSLRSR